MLLNIFQTDTTLIFKSPSVWNFIFPKLKNLLDKYENSQPQSDLEMIRNNLTVFMINKLLLNFLKFNQDNEEERAFTAALQV